VALWPWYLVSFAQGFNIISRLMMIMPHATRNQDGAQVFNTSYVILTLISMLLSSFFLWYTELPDVRMGLLRK
jgi:zinc transporter ZupT